MDKQWCCYCASASKWKDTVEVIMLASFTGSIFWYTLPFQSFTSALYCCGNSNIHVYSVCFWFPTINMLILSAHFVLWLTIQFSFTIYMLNVVHVAFYPVICNHWLMSFIYYLSFTRWVISIEVLLDLEENKNHLQFYSSIRFDCFVLS